MTELSNRIANRIQNSDNFENVAYVCCDWEEFVFEVAEWGVDPVSYTHLTLPTTPYV